MSTTSNESLRKHVRSCFPQLTEGQPIFLDNAAGSMVPARVINAVSNVLTSRGVCNSMTSYASGREQIAVKHDAHEATALFVNAADASEIAIGPSSTAMSFRLAAACARNFTADAAVVISGLEHECNASPWRETSAEIRIWEPRWPEGQLFTDDLLPLLADGRVRVVALTACSNAFGLTTPVAAAAAITRAAGAIIVVDAVHSAPHELPDVRRDDIDCLLFSPYKIFAPHLGVLYVRSDLLQKLNVPTLWFYDKNIASKFEYGTPPFESLAGWTSAMQYLIEDVGGAVKGTPISRLSLENAYKVIATLEEPLVHLLISGFAAIHRVTIYGTHDITRRVGTLAFNIQNIAPDIVARRLFDKFSICVSSGHFYATLPVTSLGLMPLGVVRVSITHYNTIEEIEKLIDAVKKIAAEVENISSSASYS